MKFGLDQFKNYLFKNVHTYTVKEFEETFGGSLPAFIAAFTSGKKLTKQEVEEIQKMIDEFKK